MKGRRAGVCFGAFLLVACTDPAALDSVAFDLVAYPMPVVSGDTARMQVTVQNVSDHPKVLRFSSACRVLSRVVAEDGIEVAAGSDQPCAPPGSVLELAPAEFLRVVFSWSVQQPPGAYRVFAYLDERRVREAGPVEIRVIAPPP